MATIDPGLAGKRILVTGASRGIGAAAARAFADAGAHLALHYNRDPGEANGIVHTCLLQGDFTRMADVDRVVEEAIRHLGGLDVLVNNAGHMVARTPLGEMRDADIDAIFDLNARSVIVACRQALPALEASGGSIINVTSIAARNGGSAGSSLYASSKGFVSTFTRSLATELAPRGIRVNAVSPGVIETYFHDVYSTPDKLEAARQRTPLQRLGSPEDCAGAFLYLASPTLGGYVTGQIIEVNGGSLMP
ncbi:MAG: SDR family oxidoreductase [Geminicoccaceae bacterium]